MDEADRPAQTRAWASRPDRLRSERARRHVRRVGLGLMLLSGLIFALALGTVLLLSGYPVTAPRWVTERVEARIDEAAEGALVADLGGVELFLEQGWRPRIRLTNLLLHTPAGREVAAIPELRLVIDRASLLEGRIRPASLLLPEVALHLRRLEDGRFDVAFGGDRPEFRALGSLPEVLGALDDLLDAPILDRLDSVAVDRISVGLDDAGTGQTWTIRDGRLQVVQTGADLRADIGFAVAIPGEAEPARADLTFVARKDSLAAWLDIDLAGVPAGHIAAQAPALAWLRLLDARVSGRLSVEADAAGAPKPVEGQLSIGPGRLSPSEALRPIPFDGARLAFTFHSEDARLTFSQIAVDSPAVRLSATGQAFLQDLPAGLVAQIALSDLAADPDGVFDAPVHFRGGQADVKVTLDPFRVTIGQAALWQDDEHVVLSGTIDGRPQGWGAALDVAIDRIGHERLLALWPTVLVPKTREWLAENVAAGEILDMRGAARITPGAEPRLSLGYQFDAAQVRALRTLPPIRQGAGRATIQDTRYTMVVDRGRVEAPEGGAMDVAGTVFSVPDIRAKPAIGELDLRAKGPVTAGLSLLDQPPFQFLTKAGKPVDIAEGQAEVTARAVFPLIARLPAEDVDYTVSARLTDVSSDRVVPDRRLAAKELRLSADRALLEIAGPGTLDGIAFTGRWQQPLTREGRDRSRVEAEVPLSPAAARAFAPGLPADLIRGGATGRLTVDIAKGAEPRFALTSDLRGAGLALPDLGWSKSAAVAGRLVVEGRLGRPVAIDRLALSAPGLTVEEGRVRIAPGGGLATARFGRVRLGGWLDAPVVLTGRGRGEPPAVTIPGGSVDLRRLPAPAARRGGTGGRSGSSIPLDVTLDRVIVTPSLALTGFTGRLEGGAGVSGPFRARVNGGPVVTGTLSPTVVRVQGTDAGAVLRAAGITPRAGGGSFDLTLTPRGSDHDGLLRIAGVSLHDAPLLARLLSAISVVGLVEQLSGEGLFFDEVTARFRLTPGAVEIKTAAATGPALGVTAAGVYLFEGQRMELTGTVSPLYLLNGAGNLMGRPGEGLFAFTYAVSGTVEVPRISVNPFSVLAPGPLRQLFQRAAPRLAE